MLASGTKAAVETDIATRIHLPPAPSAVIAAFWRLGGSGGLPVLRFLPSGCCDLVLNLGAPFDEVGGAVRIPSRGIVAVGPYDGPARYKARGPMDLFGIRLAAGQAARLLGDVVAVLARSALPIERLEPLRSALAACRDDGERMRVAQDFLESGGAVEPPDQAALAFVALAERATPLADIARRVDLSERQLERRVLRAIGMSPKRYARVARFNRALRILRHEPAVPLAEVAAASLYADQAHFTREFAALAGMTPGLYRRVGRVGFLQYGDPVSA